MTDTTVPAPDDPSRRSPDVPVDPVNVWGRTALVALGGIVGILILVLVIVGPPTAEGAGRVTGASMIPYVITALIARRRPFLQKWWSLTGLYVAVFLAMLFVTSLAPRARDF